MLLRLVTAPIGEPVTLSDVEGQCRIGSLADESATIGLFIQAVREKAETITRRQLLTAQWELTLDGFPGYDREPIELPLPPLQTVDSIAYLDVNGEEQTLAPNAYRTVIDVTPKGQPGRVRPIFGQKWPVTLDDTETVKIKFTAGYGTKSEDVPASIRQWILMNVANLYENRETETVANGKLTMVDLSTLADGLIEDFRVRRW